MATTPRSLSILIVDDEEIVHTTLSRHISSLGHTVDGVMSGDAGLEKIATGTFDLALIDVRMEGMDGLAVLEKARDLHPDLTCVIITAHRDLEVSIRALRAGAADFLLKPIKLLELEAVLERVLRVHDLRREGRHLRKTVETLGVPHLARGRPVSLVGGSDALERIREQIRLAVEGAFDTILITGETGVGKEIVAWEIHLQAEKDDAPFIAVSCPALPETLIESEIFGHVKGAFTGATMDRPGYFELADGGTLFLDEVGDLSAAAQASLLRVLETRMVRRVGGATEASIGVRVIAATNADLEDLLRKGRFRKDLFYRLNVCPIHVPPLRERTEDILPLAEHFLLACTEVRGLSPKRFTGEAEDRLARHEYPGNVRELRHVVERAAMISGDSRQVRPEHLDLIAPQGEAASARASEADRIRAMLEETQWNRRKAAKLLGMAYSTLRHKIQLYRIGQK